MIKESKNKMVKKKVTKVVQRNCGVCGTLVNENERYRCLTCNRYWCPKCKMEKPLKQCPACGLILGDTKNGKKESSKKVSKEKGGKKGKGS